MTREELLYEAGLYKAAFNYGRRKVRGAGGGAWHYAKTTKRDAKNMVKYHRVVKHMAPKNALLHQLTGGGTNRKLHKGVKLRGVFRAAHGKAAMGRLDALADRTAKVAATAGARRNTAVRRNAVRVGVAALGAGALYIGAKTYQMKKRQAQERPQFSSYDVYPQLNHSAARQQVHNRPVYYDDRDVGGGPPRVEDMNMTREELIEMMSVGALTKRAGKFSPKKYYAGHKRRAGARLKKYEKRVASNPQAQERYGKHMAWRGAAKVAAGGISGGIIGKHVGRKIAHATMSASSKEHLAFATKYPKVAGKTFPGKGLDALRDKNRRGYKGTSRGHLVGTLAGIAAGGYLAHKLTPRDHARTLNYTKGRPSDQQNKYSAAGRDAWKSVQAQRKKKAKNEVTREELISALMETLYVE